MVTFLFRVENEGPTLLILCLKDKGHNCVFTSRSYGLLYVNNAGHY